MQENLVTAGIPVGVVGLGLMGTSIVVALLAAGHPVVAIAPLAGELPPVPGNIRKQLLLCEEAGLLQQEADIYMGRLNLSADYGALAGCLLVLECVVEDIRIKKQVYQQITGVVAPTALIATNTSAIPVSLLQQHVPGPGRFLGVHWAEPAFMTRFLEITCGDATDHANAEWVFGLSAAWGKEPTLLRKDIRGFVTNRLMYAVYREGLTLAEEGQATIEDMDKAFRYDAGSWMTLMGVFRRMDYMGLQDMAYIFREIFPRLSNTGAVPAPMQRLIDQKARGAQTGQGFYEYPGQEGEEWMEAFTRFNEEIDKLAAAYPSARLQAYAEDLHL